MNVSPLFSDAPLDDILIRRAEAHEAEALAELGRNTFCDTFAHLYRPEDLHAYLERAYHVETHRRELADASLFHVVAVSGDTLAGFTKSGPCGLPVDTGGERAYELCRLYIIRSMQGRGIGRRLMDAVLMRAQEEAMDAMYLGVWEHNHAAQRFYARYGFEPAGEYRFYVGAHADRELILRKRLRGADAERA